MFLLLSLTAAATTTRPHESARQFHITIVTRSTTDYIYKILHYHKCMRYSQVITSKQIDKLGPDKITDYSQYFFVHHFAHIIQ